MIHPPSIPVSPTHEPLFVEVCANELWEGVSCLLHAGHSGSHQRPAINGCAALTWRSSKPTTTARWELAQPSHQAVASR